MKLLTKLKESIKSLVSKPVKECSRSSEEILAKELVYEKMATKKENNNRQLEQLKLSRAIVNSKIMQLNSIDKRVKKKRVKKMLNKRIKGLTYKLISIDQSIHLILGGM